MSEYPRRDPWFAHKVVRLMIRTCAAQEIGTNGFLLVTVIAHTEDAKRYSDAVTFWNDQLMSILAFASWGQLDRARKRAVDAGWLHYEPGGKGRVGKYWTTIPDRFIGLEAGPVDCDAAAILSTGGETKNPITSTSGERSGGETREKRDHSSPSPNQEPHGPRSVDQKCEGGAHDTPPRRGEHKTRVVVQANDVSQAAATIFDGCGYRGNQGGNLWKVAALQEAGLVGEGEVAAACRGAKLNGNDKPAHFYTCLKETLAKRGEDLGALLNGVRIEPQWPKSRPKSRSSGVRLKQASDGGEKTPQDLARELAEYLAKGCADG